MALYHLRARARGAGAAGAAPPARPAGPLVWMAADSAAGGEALAALARHLRRERPALTAALAAPGAPPAQPGLIALPPLPDTRAASALALAHWRPAAAVLAGGALRPALAEAARRARVPVLWLDAGGPGLALPGRWPRLARRTLAQAHAVHARDAAAAAVLAAAGAPAERLRVAGSLAPPPSPLRANEAERAALARALGTRPVWLATALTADEVDAVAAAHLTALRETHRLLLIAVPEPSGAAAALAARLSEVHGLIVGRRSAEDEITDAMQVYLADTEGEHGLWYRLAPLAYLGGTLSAQGCVRDPCEAAGLGCAIIHGPGGGAAAAFLDRLAAAGGTRPVASGADLGDAVAALLACDLAAALAQVAWAQATEGAAAAALAVAELLPLVDAA